MYSFLMLPHVPVAGGLPGDLHYFWMGQIVDFFRCSAHNQLYGCTIEALKSFLAEDNDTCNHDKKPVVK